MDSNSTPENQPRNAIVSNLLAIGGVVVICIPLTISAFEPRLPIAIAMAIGIVLGVPLLVTSFRVHPNDSLVDSNASKSFWPSRSEWWGMVAILTYALCFLVPVGVLVISFSLLPKVDSWEVAWLRLFVLSIVGYGIYGWARFASVAMPHWFRDKLADGMRNTWIEAAPTQRRETLLEAFIHHWHLPCITLIAICIASGVIDFHSPWFGVDPKQKHTRGFPIMIQWCRDNPKTVLLGSLFLAIGSSAWYGLQILRASKKLHQQSRTQ